MRTPDRQLASIAVWGETTPSIADPSSGVSSAGRATSRCRRPGDPAYGDSARSLCHRSRSRVAPSYRGRSLRPRQASRCKKAQARPVAWAGKIMFASTLDWRSIVSASSISGANKVLHSNVAIDMRIALAAIAVALIAGLGGTVVADASPSSTSRLITELSWSPDPKWLAFVAETDPSGLRPGVQILHAVRGRPGVRRSYFHGNQTRRPFRDQVGTRLETVGRLGSTNTRPAATARSSRR